MCASGHDLQYNGNANKRMCSDLLIVSHYHRYILKNLAILFATIFISASVKIGVDMNRQVTDFKFNFSRNKVA